MKAQSSLKNMVLSLTLICAVSAAVLACVNKATSDAVEQSKQQQRTEAVAEVFGNTVQYAEVQADSLNGVSFVRALDGNGDMVAVAVEAVSEKGFGGRLVVMVGFDARCAVTGYKILESAETPGLGGNADHWFQAGEGGSVIGMNPGDAPLAVSKDGGQVDAISGSTITSRAFCEAVNTAYATAAAIFASR